MRIKFGSSLSFFSVLGLAACGGDDKRSGADDSTASSTVGDTDYDDSGNSGGTRLDIGDGMDGGENPDCVDPSGSTEVDFKFSIIWIANSPEGTVSKIDTITATELARYRTGPEDLDGPRSYLGPGASLSPSRTSVNLKGDVVVGNRGVDNDPDQYYHSSFTKIIGDRDHCQDKNGDGTILTSTGRDDILGFDEDECIDWHYPTEGKSGRAVAWDAGKIDACGVSKEPAVWVGFLNEKPEGRVAEIHLLDEWGNVLGQTEADQNLSPLYGIYGGAVDGEGNFFGIGSGALFRVDRETLELTYVPGGGYSIAMDKEGNPWGSAGGGRSYGYIQAEGTEEALTGAIGGYDRGIVIDSNGWLWIATNDPCGFVRYDMATGIATDPQMTYPGCETPVGVSVDFEGHIWIVDRDAYKAVKIRPNELGQGAEVVGEVDGLVEPYTYSDMTGAMLNLVATPQVG